MNDRVYHEEQPRYIYVKIQFDPHYKHELLFHEDHRQR